MKYAIKLTYDNGMAAYLEVKGRYTWKTKRAALKHYDVCMQLFAKGRFFREVVDIELVKGFFA